MRVQMRVMEYIYREMVNACNVTENECGTDPYCPPIWTMSSDDAPFKIESDEELPAGTGKQIGGEAMWDTITGGGCYEGLRNLT